MIVLDFGCGQSKRPGSVGVDLTTKYSPDVVHDLNSYPYPFPDCHADRIYLDNLLEHLDDVIGVMSELYRICKPGGEVIIIVPSFRSLYASLDPTHKHAFTVSSMGYFDRSHKLSQRYGYSDVDFTLERVVFDEGFQHKAIRRFAVAIANRYPHHYEFHLSHLLPLDSITYYLRKKQN